MIINNYSKLGIWMYWMSNKYNYHHNNNHHHTEYNNYGNNCSTCSWWWCWWRWRFWWRCRFQSLTSNWILNTKILRSWYHWTYWDPVFREHSYWSIDGCKLFQGYHSKNLLLTKINMGGYSTLCWEKPSEKNNTL